MYCKSTYNVNYVLDVYCNGGEWFSKAIASAGRRGPAARANPEAFGYTSARFDLDFFVSLEGPIPSDRLPRDRREHPAPEYLEALNLRTFGA